MTISNQLKLGTGLKVATFALLAMSMCAGCALNRKVVINDPVGPHSPHALSATSEGQLVVYSAIEPTGGSYDYPPPRTDYSIYTPEGDLLKEVRNHRGGFDDQPEIVSLPQGRYLLSANAIGFTQVTLPVVIVRGKTTSVHLDSSGWELTRHGNKGNFVTLPDGQIVGWHAAYPAKLTSND